MSTQDQTGLSELERLVADARRMRASDIHLTEGMPVWYRIHGRMVKADIQLPEGMIGQLIEDLTGQNPALEQAENGDASWQASRCTKFFARDLDVSMKTSDGFRQRVNIFRQQGRLAATIRLLNETIPTLETLKMPTLLYNVAASPRGLVLVTGPTGSGKSTTLASMIEYINQNSERHVITIEDPIEYVYESKRSLIHQRETGADTADFASALRSALREDPDVILVGEMRDYETISAALLAAETGHLVFSTLHTTGAAQTVERIIDACPAGGQNQVRVQLAGTLKCIVSQCLIPCVTGTARVPATEILVGTDGVRNLIREGKTHQIPSLMQAGTAAGMHTLNMDLERLVRTGYITPAAAEAVTNDREELALLLNARF